MLNSVKCINMHAQRVWLITVWGCGLGQLTRSLELAETCPGQNRLTCVLVWMLLTVIIYILYRYHLKTRHHKFGEKTKNFSYPDYYTYLVGQHQGCGPDNRGSTVLWSSMQSRLKHACVLRYQKCSFGMACMLIQGLPDDWPPLNETCKDMGWNKRKGMTMEDRV